MDKDWDFISISEHPNITWDIIRNNPKYPWDYEYVSQNPNITWDIVKFYPDIKWEYYWIICNPTTTWEIIKQIPRDILKNNSAINFNPNITYDIYKNNKNNQDFHWDEHKLFQNIFGKDKEIIYEKEYRKHIARFKINIWLSSILLSPHTRWGKKHLERKMEELYQ